MVEPITQIWGYCINKQTYVYNGVILQLGEWQRYGLVLSISYEMIVKKHHSEALVRFNTRTLN